MKIEKDWWIFVLLVVAWSLFLYMVWIVMTHAHDLPGVPEPATVGLLSLGLAGLGFSRRKKNS